MNIIWIILLILAFAESGFSQHVTVINSLGASVYVRPTFDSPTRAKFPLGESIRVEREIETKERYTVGEGFSFGGKWLKPVGMNGYVFSSDVTYRRVRISVTEYGNKELQLLGELLSEKEEVKMIRTENGEFPESTTTRVFEYGSEKGTYWDGCVDYSTEYTGLPIHEAYHQMVQEHLTYPDGIMEIPRFTGKSRSTFTFEVQFGAIEDLKLFVSADDKVVMTYYVCY
jgi:hypothetical protein